MNSKLLDLGKGVCIGIANVIPGFSGGTMAVILGVYQRFINALGNFFKSPIKIIKDIWGLFLGIIIGICLSIFLVVKLLELYPVPTILFFVGLIIGSVPDIYFSSKEYGKIEIKDVIGFIIAIAVIVILPFIKQGTVNTDISFYTYPLMFILGAICAAAMVIPGVSGSLVLMAFGYYLFITTNIKEFFEMIIKLDFSNIYTSFFILFFFGIGAIIGVVFISKLIMKMFKKFPKTVYFVILGLLFASPFVIIITVIDEYGQQIESSGVVAIIIGIICMLIGMFIAGFIPYNDRKKKKLVEESKL